MKLRVTLLLLLTMIPIGKLWAWEQDFVYAEGNKLMLNGQEYYFSAANSYETIFNTSSADAIFEQANTLGVNAIRIWGFWNDPNEAGALQRAPGVFPEENWVKFDYVLWKAEQMGIKLIIPLGNYWDEFGGINYYVEHSATATDSEDFYTDANTIQMYQNYISQVLNRQNTYKGGKRYKDDSTVMIWELMNEPRGKSDVSGDKVYTWVNDMAKFVHDLDPQRKQLVASGEEGFFSDYGTSYDTPNEGSYFPKNSASPEIDVLSFHLWPISWGKDATAEAFIEEWIAAHKAVADSLNKPTYLGEFGWQINRTENSTVESRNVIYDWTYEKARQYNLPGTGFWVITVSQDESKITGGDSRFPVLVPGDSETNTIIQNFSNDIKSTGTKITDFNADFYDVTPGNSAVITWRTRYADSVTLDGQSVAKSGSITISPNSSKSYVLEAYGQVSPGVWDTVSQTITVTVSPARAESIQLTTSLTSIAFGERVSFNAQVLDQMNNPFSTNLNWSVNGGGNLLQSSGGNTTFISDGSKGNFVVSATFNNLTENTVVKVGEKKINDDALTFSDGWNLSLGDGKFRNDDHYSFTPDSTYELNFYGTSIAIFGPKASHHGTGWVSLNGGAEEAASFKAPLSERDVQIWKSPTLALGWHTLKLRVGDDGVVVADRFDIETDDPTADINDDFFQYSGSWTAETASGKFYNDIHSTSQAGASYSLTVLGKKVQLIAPTAPGYGSANVNFNGQNYSVDFSSSTEQDNVVIWESPEVTYGTYDVTVTANGNGTIVADKATITKVIPSNVYNDDGFTYFGNWNQSTGTDKYQEDDHYSAENGASFEVSFTGTSVKIYGPVASHHGKANVYIDNVNVGTADFSNDTRIANTVIWESAALSNGVHTLRVESQGNGVIVADRVDAYTQQSNSQNPLYLEAESASVSATLQTASSEGNFTGSGYVTGFNESTDELTWEFTVAESRSYQLIIRYAAGYGTKYNSVYIDDVKDSLVEFPATNDFSTWNTTSLTRTLNAGTHKVSIKMDGDSWGWVNVDALTVQ